MEGLSGQVVAVTGAAGGIGRAVCERLEREGAQVFALDSRESPDRPSLVVDVTSAESLGRAAAEVVRRAGRVDGLVAAAGVVEDDVAAETMAQAVFERTVAVNLTGVFLSCQAFGRPMLAAGRGAIVAISSMSGNHVVNTPQNQCAYNASKAGVGALTRSLAAEWVGRGVRVNSIAPGYVDTPLLALKQHQVAGWLESTPAGRMARPEEIAASTAFLLSSDAQYYCGSELLVDGGYSLR